MLGRDTSGFQYIDTPEKHFFVFEIVPCRVEAALLKIAVAVFDRRESCRDFLITACGKGPLARLRGIFAALEDWEE